MFHICRVYVSVCISMCLHVCGCICVCLCVLRYSLPFSLSLSLSFSHIFSFISSLSHPFTRVLSFLSLSPFFLSRPFALLSPHIRAHMFFPPAFLSLPVVLPDIPRALSSLSLSRCTDNLNFHISTELNSTWNKETTRDRTKIIIASRSIPRLELVVNNFHPPLRPLARVYCRSFSFVSFANPTLFSACLSLLSLIDAHLHFLSLVFSPFHSLTLAFFLSVSICGESSPKILYVVLQWKKKEIQK